MTAWRGLTTSGPSTREVGRTMLVLSRKLGEKIIIGNDIVVTVVKIDRNQVRIGIEAPSEIAVYREEIAPSRLSREQSELATSQ